MEIYLPEIPRMHTALAEWSACMIFVLVLRNKLQGIKLVIFSLVMLLFQSGLQIFAKYLPLGLWIVSMLVAVGLMFIFLSGACSLSPYDTAYYCVRAFVLAEFAASLEWQVYCFVVYPKDSRWDSFWRIGIMFGIFGLVFLAAYLLETKFSAIDRVLNTQAKDVMMSVIIGMAAFAISNISFVYTNTPFSASSGFYGCNGYLYYFWKCTG